MQVILDLATDIRRPPHVLVDAWGVGRIGLGVLLAGVTVAGCGGGHSHASPPGAAGTQVAAGAQVATGAGAPPAHPVINGPASTGQAAVGQGSSVVLGFPVGPLLPTAVDGGQCQAAQFADKSVYEQIAIARAACAQVPTVAAGADRARGSSYSAAGFGCAATAQQPSNGYWISPYVSYNCRSGDDQIAFNWGTSSSRF
jgi:hypothetical protein